MFEQRTDPLNRWVCKRRTICRRFYGNRPIGLSFGRLTVSKKKKIQTPTLDARLETRCDTLRFIDTLDPEYVGAVETLVRMGKHDRIKAQLAANRVAANGEA